MRTELSRGSTACFAMEEISQDLDRTNLISFESGNYSGKLKEKVLRENGATVHLLKMLEKRRKGEVKWKKN